MRTIARTRAFSLLELLVALAVFAAMAAAAYGGLASIARTRATLAAEQDRFTAMVRAVGALERDLRQAVARPVLGNDGRPLPALLGRADAIELTRLGFANPRAEPRSNLQRVAYVRDGDALVRLRYAVLDRAPDSLPARTPLLAKVTDWRLRYLGEDGAWREQWPPGPDATLLPRAVEFRFDAPGYGGIRRVVELPTTLPLRGGTNSPPGGGTGVTP